MNKTPSPTPSPVNRNALSRASLVGAILGTLSIILFVVLWIVLGKIGAAQMPRLFLSLCIPPVIVASLFGAYVLYSRSRL